MNQETEFRVQYKDSYGVWSNVYGSYASYSEALDKLMVEAKSDPEYTHRIVRVSTEVFGYITGEGNINE